MDRYVSEFDVTLPFILVCVYKGKRKIFFCKSRFVACLFYAVNFCKEGYIFSI